MRTIQEVVSALNFPVSLRKNRYIDNAGISREGIGVQVVREDTNTPIAQNSDGYGLIKHGDALSPILSALDGMDFSVKNFYMDHEGRSVMVKALSKQSWTVGKLADGRDDTVLLSLMFINSYDRTKALKLVAGAFRLVCSNGLVVSHPAFAEMNINLRIVHSKHQLHKFDATVLANKVAHIYAAMDKQTAAWSKWNQTTISRTALATLREKVLEPVVGVRAVDEVVSKVFRGQGQDGRLTPWSILNGVTEYLSARAEQSKTPVASHLNAMTRTRNLTTALEGWMVENPEQVVTVNA